MLRRLLPEDRHLRQGLLMLPCPALLLWSPVPCAASSGCCREVVTVAPDAPPLTSLGQLQLLLHFLGLTPRNMRLSGLSLVSLASWHYRMPLLTVELEQSFVQIHVNQPVMTDLVVGW
jgi:hypothetical protein